MINEEILKIAKEKYPIGTVFKSAITGDIFTVEDNSTSLSSTNICFKTKEKNKDGNFFACVCTSKGKWAEIISTPNKNYELW